MSLGISRVCQSIAPSATFAMDAKAKALVAAGEKVYSFAAGEPDFDTPAPIRDAMKDALDRGMTRYSVVAGTLELRDAVIEKLKRDNGLAYERGEIICSNGAKHSLFTIFQTILDPGDEVIIPTPCWVSYPEMVRMAGGKPVFVSASETEGFIPPIERIASLVTPRTKAFILTSPNNPNGCVWPREALEKLAQLAVAKDFYVVSDEIYEHLIYGGAEHISIASVGEEIKRRTLLVNGVSKTYAMTGFRIGYVAGPKDVIAAMTTYQSQATSGPNTPAQHAAAVALTMPQDCVEEMRAAFEKRRDLLCERLNAIPGVSCLVPQGAFYVMANISGCLGKRYKGLPINDSATFATTLVDAEHVVTVPGGAFMAEGYVRLSYATSAENIREGMRRLAAFAAALE